MGSALVWLLVIPTVGAIAAAMLGQQRPGAVRWVSLGATTVNLLLALALVISFAGPRLRAGPVYYASNPGNSSQTFQPPIKVTWDVLSFGSAFGQDAKPS